MQATAPERFVCPISMAVMVFPVRTETGHVFERQAIMQWLYFEKPSCPMSRKPLHPADIKPDHALAREIRQWRLENNIPVDEAEEEEIEDDLQLPTPSPITPVESKEKTSHLLSLRERVLQKQRQRATSFQRRAF